LLTRCSALDYGQTIGVAIPADPMTSTFNSWQAVVMAKTHAKIMKVKASLSKSWSGNKEEDQCG